MFIAALFTRAKSWKQPGCPLTDEWINKMWYIHTVEYHSALKRKEILPHATTLCYMKEASCKKEQILYDSTYMST